MAIAHWIALEDFLCPDHAILGGLRQRFLRLVRIRWGVVAGISLVILVAGSAGVILSTWIFGPLMAAAAAGNLFFHLWSRRLDASIHGHPQQVLRFSCWQTGMDLGLLVLLVLFTGGFSGPLPCLLILQVGWMSLALPESVAIRFDAAALAALIGLSLLEAYGLIPLPIPDMALPPRGHRLLDAGVLFIVLAATAWIVLAGRKLWQGRLWTLTGHYRALASANEKLTTLFSIIEAVGYTQRLERVSRIITSEFAAVMQVQGISVKLLTEDGKHLQFIASYGLPEKIVREKQVEVEKSPLNKRILDGEPYVTGQVTAREMFQFGEALAEADIRSVLFLPLTMEGRVIGILGAYCVKPDRFTPEEVEYFRLAAGLVSMVLENARAYEAVENLVQERSWYMMRATHNLRAPLAAMLSILEVVRSGYLGELNAEQQEYLRRLDRRTRAMLTMINELMTLAKNRDQKMVVSINDVDPHLLARRIRRTFQDEAGDKGVGFEVAVPEDLPAIRGNLEMVEQVLENLVSNAIKYTPSGGSVAVRFQHLAGSIRIEVQDTGIGIPREDLTKLFSEFFRAKNAKAVEKLGTGVGLAIVREVVNRLGGRVHVESEEGAGTLFVVQLPATDKNGSRQ